MGLEQYSDLELIGEGVSAKVYKARDARTGALVALKILNPHLQTDEVSLERFRREIQITRLLQAPQIVSIYDLISDGQQTCLVMEYIEGQNLKDFIAANQPLPIETVVAILRQVLGVLSVCHAKNVIHRDLKPQNILVGADTTIRLVDFGIAKMTTLSDLTQTGSSIGSPEYMAPELFAANTFDPRTDLYALGIIAYEMLAGAPPFRGDSLALLYSQHRTVAAPPLAEVRRDVPQWLQQVIDRMLAKLAYERYQSADEVTLDLRQRRVLAREIPSLSQSECVRCGQATLADLPVCLSCGHNVFEAVQNGTHDILCTTEEDDGRIEAFLQAVFGLSEPLQRGRRTLLIGGVDQHAAELIQQSARQHQVLLTIAPHTPATEFRKAAALALTCLILSWFAAILGRSYAFYGSSMLQAFRGISLLQIPMLAFALAVLWMAMRRFRSIEVEPVFSVQEALRRNRLRDYDWLRRLVPSLTPDRTEAMRSCVAQLIHKYFTLVRFGRRVDPTTTQSLEALLTSSAQLASVVSELETALQAPAFAERAQRYSFVDGQLRSATDPAQRSALALQRQTLHEEVSAYVALEEKYAALSNKLVALQAFFNRLLGRLLVFNVPIDRDTNDLLASNVHTLAEDVVLSRQIQVELARLV